MNSENRSNRGLGILLAVAVVIAVLAALVFFTPLGMIVFIPIQMAKIHRVEKRMQTPEIYREVGTNLALYCQSAEDLNLTNTLGPSRLPQPLPQLGSPRGMFNTNFAHVEFGGGFYHYGYSIELDESASARATNVWELRFVSENRASEKLLLRFAIPASARYSMPAFLKNSLAEYDVRIAKSPGEIALYKAKINLLSQYDRAQLRPACIATIKALPDHWWPRLTLALLDTGGGNFAAASSNLVTYVEAKPSYSRYIYLAYFYQLTDKPDDAAKAVEKAVTFPITDLADDETNSECRGYSAGVYLYEHRKYSSVIKLCDSLLPISINGNYAKSALDNLKASAQASLSGTASTFVRSEEVLGFDAYENFDIRSILSR
jgi:hypothetical protein